MITACKLDDILRISPLYRFVLLPESVLIHPSAPKDLPHSQSREFVSPTARDPLGMRVAELPGHHRMHTVKEDFAIEGTEPLLSEQEPRILWREQRRSVRALVGCRVIVADKVGLANGQVVDMTTRGCGLRLTKPLTRGQYLTLKVYPNDGTASVQCDLGMVQWVKEGRAGVVFLWMSRVNASRLHQLCGDRLGFED
ncbi:MAG TPA: PilZ domain-containing protein [Nitrospiraceae bacterium]|nr:PilZ domain-containing protein [Nitrospiraceae bacterium]